MKTSSLLIALSLAALTSAQTGPHPNVQAKGDSPAELKFEELNTDIHICGTLCLNNALRDNGCGDLTNSPQTISCFCEKGAEDFAACIKAGCEADESDRLSPIAEDMCAPGSFGTSSSTSSTPSKTPEPDSTGPEPDAENDTQIPSESESRASSKKTKRTAIGAGVGIGGSVLVAIIASLFWYRRRRSQRAGLISGQDYASDHASKVESGKPELEASNSGFLYTSGEKPELDGVGNTNIGTVEVNEMAYSPRTETEVRELDSGRMRPVASELDNARNTATVGELDSAQQHRYRPQSAAELTSSPVPHSASPASPRGVGNGSGNLESGPLPSVDAFYPVLTSSNDTANHEQNDDEDFAYQERRLAERRARLAERERIAAEERQLALERERLAEEEEALRRRMRRGGSR